MGEREITGIERLREAIRRDRGEFAPVLPVTLCGEPDGTEVRAGEPVWMVGRVNCEHRYKRVRWWMFKPRSDRWRCVWCGLLTRHYDGTDFVAGRPVHRHMSVALKGVNTVGVGR